MQVEAVMTPLIVSINADAPVASAAELMRTNNVGFLPVREGGRLVGIITDRDITVRAAAPSSDLGETRVDEVMTRSVVSVRKSAQIDEALRLMEREGVSRLMVTDEQNQLVGVLSIRDIPQAPIR